MTGETVVGLIEDFAAAAPGAPALIDAHGVVTATELAARARRVAGGLRRLGVGEGDRVALWLPNCPAYLALCLGCARLGAIAVAINTRFRSAEVADIVGRSGATALVLWPGFKGIDFAAILRAMPAAALPELRHLVAYGGDAGDEAAGVGGLAGLPWPVLPYGQLEAAPPLAENVATPDTPCNIFTTSGTTRAPKLVLHRQFAIARHARLVAPAFGYDRPGTVLLQALPLGGVFGYAQAMATLAARAPLVLLPAFEAAAAARAIRQHRVSDFNATDDMVARILDAADSDWGERPFPDLRAIGYAAFNPALEDLPERAAARGITLCGLYGMSEVQALFARQPVAAPLARRRLAGGVPTAPDAAVRARDPDSGALLKHGEAGELEFRGPSLFVGYYHNAAATAEAFTQDGFFRSGDLGYTVARADGGGFVFLSRLGDVLRLGGYLVSPAEIEDHLMSHPTVAGACVVAVATPQGNRPVAFVIPRAGAGSGASPDEAVLIAHCKAALAGFKVPLRVATVEDFPSTDGPNGVKIQRHLLRQKAAALLAK